MTKIKQNLIELSQTGYATPEILNSIKQATEILKRDMPKPLYKFYKHEMRLSYVSDFDIEEVKESAKLAAKLLLS